MNEVDKGIVEGFLLVVELRARITKEASALRVTNLFDKVTSDTMIYPCSTKEGWGDSACIGASLDVYLRPGSSFSYACLSLQIFPIENGWRLEREIGDEDDRPILEFEPLHFREFVANKGLIMEAIEDSVSKFCHAVRSAAK